MINKKKNSIDLLFLSILDQLEIFYSMPIETWIKVWENYCNHINTKIKFHNNLPFHRYSLSIKSNKRPTKTVKAPQSIYSYYQRK